MCSGLRIFRDHAQITNACQNTNLGPDTVAVSGALLVSDLTCGTRICIRVGSLGVIKTVTDRCGKCGTGKIDNFTTNTSCQVVDFASTAVTLKLFD